MRTTRLRYLAFILVLATLFVVFQHPLATHAKTLLLLSQALPQSPVKPLNLVTAAPMHTQLQLESPHGPIVADLLVPTSRFGRAQDHTQPALIFAMGVRIADEDRPILLAFAETMARLGHVVLWPRSEPLDRGEALPEEPATFVTAVRYLQGLDQVDQERISIFGISMGGSIALVAANDPEISKHVRALIFFGGYYDILTYITSLATHSFAIDGQRIDWSPYDGTVAHARNMLEAKGARDVGKVFDATTQMEAELLLTSASPSEIADLRRISPAGHLENLTARLFILHDRGDRSVPYAESVQLDRALPAGTERTFLLTDLFEHVQPKEGDVSWQTVRDLFSVYGFVYATLSYL